MITKSICLCFSLILFNHLWDVNGTEFTAHKDGDGEFFDLGIRLKGAKRDSLIADLIAEESEFVNDGHIDGIELYHLHLYRKRNHRSKRSIDELVEVLKQDERIEHVVIGEKLERQKRDFLDEKLVKKFFKKLEQTKLDEEINDYDDTHVDHSKFQMGFNDQLYTKQWYLENKGQFDNPPNHDANLPPAWLAGYSGKGVIINIVDDGLDHSHSELSNRYRADLSYDLNDLNDTEHDPMPSSFDGTNSHGTYCAGAAVAEANNGLCGVGPAFGAYIAGIRLLDGPVTTLTEARSITMFAPNVDIMSASWGPIDDGTRMEAPGSLITSALNYAVTKGRHGKGTVIVFAAGNGGIQGDHCGADGYASHYNVISIGTINHLGQTAYFDERCASTMAVTYTGGPHKPYSNEKILQIAVVTSDVQNKCKTDFYGTSGAAPVAAGIFALALEANTELTYRDVMHIVAQTSRIPNLEETSDWIINGAGYHVSHKFGFGTLDAGQMVAAAQNWTNVPSRSECYYEHRSFTRRLGIGTITEVSINIRECFHVTNLEHVVANVSFIFHRRGDVKIILISPSGTPSEMLGYRPNDATSEGIQYFPYTSVHHWDESPIGIWTLRMETRQPQDEKSQNSAMNYDGRSEINHFGLRLYGSDKIDNNHNLNKRSTNMAFVPNTEQLEMLYKRELALRETPNIMQKRDHDLLAKKRTQNNTSEGGFFSFLRRIFTL